MNNLINDLATAAQNYFLHPEHQLRWNDIILGTTVTHRGGRRETVIAVGSNTFRGFHRIDKCDTGPQAAFTRYFIAQRARLLRELPAITTAAQLHQLSNRLRSELIAALDNVRPDQLLSYNKVRKPIDLYLEHFVRLATDLQPLRARLIPLLHLPLDSWILDHPAVFSEGDLRSLGLARGLTYGDIHDESTYLALQDLAAKNARAITASIGTPFHRIYYDMLWSDRLAFYRSLPRKS
jgi:hypothetical protein